MKSIYFIGIMAMAMMAVSCEKETGLSEDEIVSGLRDALNHGTDTAVSRLSVADGYFGDELVKILLPEEAQPVYDVVQMLPTDIIDKTVLAINRAAEDAAVEAKPIFINAITELTISDGLNILHGTDTAATHYLRDHTYEELFAAFKPKIETSLSKDIVFGLSAEELYGDLIGYYNTGSLNGLLYDEITTNSLSEHTTRKALNGLFIKVGAEEKLIREDPAHRVTDILEKVFAEQD